MYDFLKWLHILAAIAAIGANITYGVWLARAPRQPQALLFTLRTVKFIDDRIANPAYGLSLISGIALVLVGNWRFNTPWLEAALGLYVALVLIGVLGYTPTLKRQIKVAENSGAESPEYVAIAKRGTIIGGILAVIALTIVYLMAAKPTLWG